MMKSSEFADACSAGCWLTCCLLWLHQMPVDGEPEREPKWRPLYTHPTQTRLLYHPTRGGVFRVRGGLYN